MTVLMIRFDQQIILALKNLTTFILFQAIAWHPWRSGLLAVGEGPPGPSSLSLWNANTGVMVHMEKLSPPTIVLALDFNKLSGELVCSVQTNGKVFAIGI